MEARDIGILVICTVSLLMFVRALLKEQSTRKMVDRLFREQEEAKIAEIEVAKKKAKESEDDYYKRMREYRNNHKSGLAKPSKGND